MDRLRRATFGDEVVPRLGRVDEQELRDLVGQKAVQLLGHGAVEATKPRLDVADRDAALGRREGGGERRVHVSGDEDDVRLDLQQQRFETRDNTRRLLSVRPRADAEKVIGLADAEVLEEDLGHLSVVVLSGVNEHQVEGVGMAAELGHDRGHLHEVRPSAYDRENRSSFPHAMVSSRRAGWPRPAACGG